MWVHLPPPPRCLTSGLDSLASVSTRAVALTAWASSCSTSLWVLAASRILGRTREGKSSTWEGLQLLFFRRAERAQSQRLFQQVVESPTPFLRLCHLGVQLEEDLMLKINVCSSSKRLDVKSLNSFFFKCAPFIGSQIVKIKPLSTTTTNPLYDRFTKFTNVIKIFMVLIEEDCNKPTEPERQEVLGGTQTGL